MSDDSASPLRALAKRRGLQLQFVDTLKRRVVASNSSIRAVLAAMGDDVSSESAVRETLGMIEREQSSRLAESVIVLRAGAPLRIPLCRSPKGVLETHLRTEAGETVRWSATLTSSKEPALEDPSLVLETGYYELTLHEAGEIHEVRLLVAPERVWRPAPGGREWGLFAPLYAIRGESDRGIGSYADLGRMLDLAGARGAAFAGTLPLYASFLDVHFDPSPYAPVSRLFWNEAHLSGERPGRESAISRTVRWQEIGRQTLESTMHEAQRIFAGNAPRASFDEWERAHPLNPLYGAFRARIDTERRGWRDWVDASPSSLERWVETPLAQWFRWAQWKCDAEIMSLASRDTGLYLDFPLGSNADGFDVWYWRDLYVDAASIGAPPDLAYRTGQDWGFRPPHPERMRREGWRHWRDLIRRAMEPASMLRLDHVMGLHRMWWVPQGRTADHGVYVHYASEELYAILAIESHRAQCLVVGEDLGTVPPAVTRSMKKHGVPGMWALERQLTHAADGRLAPIREDRVVSIGTHDMPPFAAFLEGSDVEEKGRLGVIEPARLDAERAKRPAVVDLLRVWVAQQTGRDAGSLDPCELLERVLDALARSPARWMVVNVEDLWLETISQNIPTTTTERPNWRPRLKLTLAELERDPEVRRLLQRVDAGRGKGPRTGDARSLAEPSGNPG